MGFATVSSVMTDYKQKRKPAPAQLLAGFGAVIPKQKPEDWRKMREDMEATVAEEGSKEDGKA
jgi:hypothetical protein